MYTTNIHPSSYTHSAIDTVGKGEGKEYGDAKKAYELCMRWRRSSFTSAAAAVVVVLSLLLLSLLLIF